MSILLNNKGVPRNNTDVVCETVSNYELNICNSDDFTKAFTFTASSVPSADRTISLYDPGADVTLQFGKSNSGSITQTTTLTSADSGTIYGLTTSASGALAITLPPTASSAGCNFKFILNDKSNANNITFVSDGANIKGRKSDTGHTLDNLSGTTLTMVQAQAQEGDYVSLICNGTYWFLDAWSSSAGAAFTIS